MLEDITYSIETLEHHVDNLKELIRLEGATEDDLAKVLHYTNLAGKNMEIAHALLLGEGYR